jgi:hypothetical protein
MRNRINKAIKHTGLKLEGGRGVGCFYFSDSNGHAVENSTVWVSAMTHLPISRWVEEAEGVAKGMDQWSVDRLISHIREGGAV